MTGTLAILAHDDTCSVVSIGGPETDANGVTGRVWVTFGEITPNGFSPCYGSLAVPTRDLVTVL